MSYDELPPRREPQRSRLQMDLSPESRKSIQAYAKNLRTNQKRLILEALAAQHPELAKELLAEIKRDGYVINTEIGQSREQFEGAEDDKQNHNW